MPLITPELEFNDASFGIVESQKESSKIMY